MAGWPVASARYDVGAPALTIRQPLAWNACSQPVDAVPSSGDSAARYTHDVINSPSARIRNSWPWGTTRTRASARRSPFTTAQTIRSSYVGVGAAMGGESQRPDFSQSTRRSSFLGQRGVNGGSSCHAPACGSDRAARAGHLLTVGQTTGTP